MRSVPYYVSFTDMAIIWSIKSQHVYTNSATINKDNSAAFYSLLMDRLEMTCKMTALIEIDETRLVKRLNRSPGARNMLGASSKPARSELWKWRGGLPPIRSLEDQTTE